MSITIKDLVTYPLKSGGFSLAEDGLVSVDKHGFQGDRRFMVIDENGKIVTQREKPEMSQIVTVSSGGVLEFNFGRQQLSSSPNFSALQSVTVNYRKEAPFEANDLGAYYNDAFSEWLGQPVRVVVSKPGVTRDLTTHHGGFQKRQPGFHDEADILVVGENSHEDVMRFRPNIILSGLEPHEEDNIERIEVGNVVLQRVRPATRCAMVNVDYDKGIMEEGAPVTNGLRLAGRMGIFNGHGIENKKGMMLGTYYRVVNPGILIKGSEVHIQKVDPALGNRITWKPMRREM